MSLDYHFEIATSLSPRQMLDRVSSILGCTPNVTSDSLSEVIHIQCSYFDLSLHSIPPKTQRSLASLYQIEAPTIRISLYTKDFEPQNADDDIAKLVGALLTQTDGDAVLSFEGITYLIRKSGNLFLNKAAGFWTSKRLKNVSPPFELTENLPS